MHHVDLRTTVRHPTAPLVFSEAALERGKSTMSSILSSPRKRIVQVLHSIPQYAWELLHPSPSHSGAEWLRYKFPTRFQLSELPRKLTLEITNHCNLSCPHCYRAVMKRPIGFMQLDLIKKIASQLREVPYCELKIVGLGEPALHPQFDEILEILRPVTPKSALYTNGILFVKMAPEAIIESGVRLIVVSIDGTDRESFDRHRPGGDYDRLWKDLHRFREVRNTLGRRRPTIEIRHVIHPGETSADLERFRRRVHEVSDTVKFNYVIPIERDAQREARSYKGCRDIFREMYVEWDGRVPLCGYVSLHRDAIWIGNAAETPLNELWRHPELEKIRGHHENKRYAEIPFCRNCEGC